MHSGDGRWRRPEAGALDPNTECYAGDGATDWRALVERLRGLVEAVSAVQIQVDALTNRCVRCGASPSEVARALGIHRATVYRRYLDGATVVPDVPGD